MMYQSFFFSFSFFLGGGGYHYSILFDFLHTTCHGQVINGLAGSGSSAKCFLVLDYRGMHRLTFLAYSGVSRVVVFL